MFRYFNWKRSFPVIFMGLAFIISGQNPVMAYNKDVHFSLTYYLARIAGYTQEQASRLASADNSVDTSESTDPVRFRNWISGGLTPNVQAYIDPHGYAVFHRYHAFMDGTGLPTNYMSIGKYKFTEQELKKRQNDVRTEVEKLNIISSANLHNPGAYLHAYQDIFTHSGYWTGLGHGDYLRNPIPGLLNLVPPLGHITDYISYEPLNYLKNSSPFRCLYRWNGPYGTNRAQSTGYLTLQELFKWRNDHIPCQKNIFYQTDAESLCFDAVKDFVSEAKGGNLDYDASVKIIEKKLNDLYSRYWVKEMSESPDSREFEYDLDDKYFPDITNKIIKDDIVLFGKLNIEVQSPKASKVTVKLVEPLHPEGEYTIFESATKIGKDILCIDPCPVGRIHIIWEYDDGLTRNRYENFNSMEQQVKLEWHGKLFSTEYNGNILKLGIPVNAILSRDAFETRQSDMQIKAQLRNSGANYNPSDFSRQDYDDYLKELVKAGKIKVLMGNSELQLYGNIEYRGILDGFIYDDRKTVIDKLHKPDGQPTHISTSNLDIKQNNINNDAQHSILVSTSTKKTSQHKETMKYASYVKPGSSHLTASDTVTKDKSITDKSSLPENNPEESQEEETFNQEEFDAGVKAFTKDYIENANKEYNKSLVNMIYSKSLYSSPPDEFIYLSCILPEELPWDTITPIYAVIDDEKIQVSQLVCDWIPLRLRFIYGALYNFNNVNEEKPSYIPGKFRAEYSGELAMSYLVAGNPKDVIPYDQETWDIAAGDERHRNDILRYCSANHSSSNPMMLDSFACRDTSYISRIPIRAKIETDNWKAVGEFAASVVYSDNQFDRRVYWEAKEYDQSGKKGFNFGINFSLPNVPDVSVSSDEKSGNKDPVPMYIKISSNLELKINKMYADTSSESSEFNEPYIASTIEFGFPDTGKLGIPLAINTKGEIIPGSLKRTWQSPDINKNFSHGVEFIPETVEVRWGK